jgi:hypothetical protein
MKCLRYSAVWLLSAAAAIGGCSLGDGDGDGDESGSDATAVRAAIVCSQLTEHLRSCDAISDGELGCGEAGDDQELCTAGCLMDTGCRDIRDFLCLLQDAVASNNPDSLLTLTGPLASCLQNCVRAERFDCGDGSTVPQRWVCDSEADCASGLDEEGCGEAATPFECEDGSESVPPSWVCDGPADCADGSDEAGCPVFVCGDGERFPEEFECDGLDDCADGSDEAGCPPRAVLVCDGLPVSLDPNGAAAGMLP